MEDFDDDYVPDWVNDGFSSQSDAEKILCDLNEEQRDAVIHEGSPLLILAGAGSGKTRVITTKIAYLISQRHVKPSQILSVTFTKKAANEMKERAVALEPMAQYSQIRTFHSFGSWFLRFHSQAAGIAPNFTVYDDDDSALLLKKACPTLSREQLKSYPHKIALAKDYFLTPDSPEIFNIEDDPAFQEAYSKYEKRLRETGNVDFGDLIMLPAKVMAENEEIRNYFHNRFKVIMVDEYQDTNIAQFKLLASLVGNDTYVCVVGDDDQSIYKFRGAEVQNILNFDKIFPGTKIIRLEKNYRSTSQILLLADNVVRNNDDRLGKTLVAQKGEGHQPKLIFFGNQNEESKFCCEIIEKAREKGVPYSDWAILYRTNAQSLAFETEFMHHRIPYAVVGTLKFYEREEIKDLLCCLQLLANPKDEIAFARIINKPARGIGEKTRDGIIEIARYFISETENDNQSGNVFQNDFNPQVENASQPMMNSLIDATKDAVENGKLSKKAKEGAQEFLDAFEYCGSLLHEKAENKVEEGQLPKLTELVEAFAEKMGFVDYYKETDKTTEAHKVENMQELANSAALYPCTMEGLLDFLDHIELDRTLELQDEEELSDAVTLITIHNTKGLEYNRVIMTGMENGIFPRNPDDFTELQEERRLCYVGITRAKKQIYFTSCAMRMMYGRTNPMMPSRFLKEMDVDNLKILGQVPYTFSKGRSGGGFDSGYGTSGSYNGGYGKNGLSNPQFNDPIRRKWHKGAAVYHDDWGHGAIVDTSETEDGDLVIKVSFETGGIKRFLPKYQGKDLIIEE